MTMTTPLVDIDQQAPLFQLERKMKKPLMEKRRRARINRCLSDLKQLLTNIVPHHRSKLEKADILELTVKYVTNLRRNQRIQGTDISVDSAMLQQSFYEGFSTCAATVMTFLNHPENERFPGQDLRPELLSTLDNCLSNRGKRRHFMPFSRRDSDFSRFEMDDSNSESSLGSFSGNFGNEERNTPSSSSGDNTINIWRPW